MKLNKRKGFYIFTMLLLAFSACFYLFAQDVNSDNKKNNISRVIVTNHNEAQTSMKSNLKQIIKEKKEAEARKKVEEERKRKEAEAKSKAEEERKRKEAEAKSKAKINKNKVITTTKVNNSTQNCELLFTYEEQLLCYVNNERTQKGLNKLTLNKNLSNSASIRTKEIINNFAHVRPNGSNYNTVISISHRYSGENIAAGQKSAKQVFNEWMASEGHKKNILSPHYKQMGISLHEDATQKYRYYWCQLFIG